MQKYINSVRDHIIGICDMIRGEEGLNGPDDLRVAVWPYFDLRRDVTDFLLVRLSTIETILLRIVLMCTSSTRLLLTSRTFRITSKV